MDENAYYEFTPQDLPEGIYDSPHFGEVAPGTIVEVRPHQLAVVRDSPDWARSSRSKFEKQKPIAERRARLNQPADQGGEE